MTITEPKLAEISTPRALNAELQSYETLLMLVDSLPKGGVGKNYLPNGLKQKNERRTSFKRVMLEQGLLGMDPQSQIIGSTI